MPLDKARIRFRKASDLRFVSHLDLMRSFERLLRRANLPFRMTEGFHPTPRLIFAQSLSLGLVGHSEVVELELTETIEPDDLLDRMRSQAPKGLDFLSAARVPLKVTARPRRAEYRLSPIEDTSEIGRRIAELMASPELWVERERPRPKQINIRPYIETMTLQDGAIVLSIWLTQEGSARADELVKALGLPESTVIERTALEIMDELPAEVAERTPKIEPHTRPLNRTNQPAPERPPTTETWGATENGPVVE